MVREVMKNKKGFAHVLLIVVVVLGVVGFLVLRGQGGDIVRGPARSTQGSGGRDYTNFFEQLRTKGLPCDREDSFSTAVGNIVIDHQNTNNLYITARPKGVFKSTDRGRTWKAMNEGIFAYPSQKDKGEFCYEWLGKLYMDPTNSRRILLVTTDINNGTILDPYTETGGVWETLDGGESWHQMLDDWMNAGGYGALAIDPVDPQTVYFGSGYGVASYTEADPNKFFNEIGIVYKTIDGGKNWKELATGTAPGRHGDPFITAEPTKMFINGDNLIVFPAIIEVDGEGNEVSAPGQFGILKSTDAGETWTSSTGNLPNGYTMPLRGDVSKHKFDHIWFRSWDTDFHGGQQRSYVSFDGGETYTRTSIDIDEGRYDPYDTEGLHMIGTSPFAYDMQLAESFDGGLTWENLGDIPAEIRENKVHVFDLAWDPKDENTIYITGGPPNVWRSSDAGKTWQKILSPEDL